MSDYEDMQNELKVFAKKVIYKLCETYCDLIEEHYYKDESLSYTDGALALGWIRVEWRGTEYTIPIGMNYDMEPAICFDKEGEHYESEHYAWMYIATKTFDKMTDLEKRLDKMVETND